MTIKYFIVSGNCWDSTLNLFMRKIGWFRFKLISNFVEKKESINVDYLDRFRLLRSVGFIWSFNNMYDTLSLRSLKPKEHLNNITSDKRLTNLYHCRWYNVFQTRYNSTLMSMSRPPWINDNSSSYWFVIKNITIYDCVI